MLQVVMRRPEQLRPYAKNPRKNDNAVEAVARSIEKFGWKQPVVIRPDGEVLAGHTRLKAAELLGIEEIPCVIADNLTEEQARAYRLADNRLAELAQWDFEKLGQEMEKLEAFDFDALGLDFSFLEYDTKLEENLADLFEDADQETVYYPVRVRVPNEYKVSVLEYKSSGSRSLEKALVERARYAR